VHFILFVFSWFFDQLKSGYNEKSLAKTKEEQIKKYQEICNNTEDYETWKEAALHLDQLEGREAWRKQKESPYYDWETIEALLKQLRELDKAGDIEALSFTLRSGLLRNLGGLGNPNLYQQCRVGTKYLIEEYIEYVSDILRRLCHTEYPGFPNRQKFDFFYETRQSFGRSALLLSGGAAFGVYHMGVVKALWSQNLLPRVISGSSVGSLVAALIAVRTEDELVKIFDKGSIDLKVFDKKASGSFYRRLNRFLTRGVLLDIKVLEECLRLNIGDLTFREAYQKTKRILNITVTSTTPYEPPRLLNYLTAPNVLIWSAACASCALTFLYEPVELYAKDKDGKIVPYLQSGVKWSDGSMALDLPMARLSELFNINHFIVSQVNPHVVPFLSSVESNTWWRRIRSFLYYEFRHRFFQLVNLGLLPQYLLPLQPIVTQKYDGDITIVPKITWREYANIISNPTDEYVQECILKGQQTTWPIISFVENHCRIERTLDECLLKMRDELHATFINKRNFSYGYLSPRFIQSINKRFGSNPGTDSSNNLIALGGSEDDKTSTNNVNNQDQNELPLNIDRVLSQL